MKSKIFLAMLCSVVAAGCSASTSIVGQLVLPTSGLSIDIVQHRSDSHGCAELVVLQTYNDKGHIIDSQQARGRSLPCTLVEVGIEAGSRVGSAAIIARGMVNAAKATRPDVTSIDNVNTQTQGQGGATASAAASATAQQTQGQAQAALGGQGGHGGEGGNGHNGGTNGGHGGGNGNNGGGNGGGDGTNPGTGHHHNNGDND